MSKTQELIQQLHDGVQELFRSDKYTEFLRFMASFHAYSASNCYLIFKQMPTASMVASYTDWNSKHHRQVMKGSKAIKILAPHVYKEIDEKGEEHERLGFHSASCFDVSQTFSISGEALPELCRPLDHDVAGFSDLLRLLMHVSPVPVDILDIKGEARGFFSQSALRIVVQKDMSEADTIKTLLHEQAHAWSYSLMPEGKYKRRESEVIAESTAYVVSQWLDIDTSDYSLGYVAGWSSDKTVPELRATIDTIRTISELMISKIEEAWNELYQGENVVA